METVRRCGGRISRSTRACWSTASTTVLTMSSSCATLSQKSCALDDNCRALLNFSESSTRTRYDCGDGGGRGTFGRQLTAARWDETRRARGGWGRVTRARRDERPRDGSPRAPRRTSPRVRPTSSPCGCASAMPRGPQRPRQKDFALERGRHRGRRGNQLCFFKSRGGAGLHALRTTRLAPSRSMDARAFSSPTPEPLFSTASGAPVSDPSPDTMDRARSLLDRLPSPRAPVRPPHTAARSPASRRSPTPASANAPDDRPLATDTPRRRA